MNESEPEFIPVDATFWTRVAEEKGRRRMELAAMPPHEAQALVSSLPPDGGRWCDVTPDDEWQLGFLPDPEDEQQPGRVFPSR